MKEFFSSVEKILFSDSIKEKIFLFNEFYANFLDKKVYFNHSHFTLIQTSPSYEAFCTITHPTKISRPKQLNSITSLAKIIHSITHIEYSAIDLGLDAAYRFKNLPLSYYQDWLKVASEEIKHFCLLNEVLIELGFKYGDFPVHNNLYEAMLQTHHSLFYRMGVVHRGLEATGLDANPFVLRKIQSTTHPIRKKIEFILDIILNDEISHVRNGDKWWKYSNMDNLEYVNILKKFPSFNLTGKIMNIQARIQAGFSQKELQDFKNHYKLKI